MMFFIKAYNKLNVLSETILCFGVKPTPYFSFIECTNNSQVPTSFSMWFRQVFCDEEHHFSYWPVHPSSQIANYKNIKIEVDTSPGYMRGCYIQGISGIEIGDYTQISSNVRIQSSNHNLFDLREYVPCKPIKIGAYCLLAMKVMILPEVELGDFTIVGAGSVVTKSFPEGHCVVAGNPAKKLRDLKPSECLRYREKNKYIGFIKKRKVSKL